MNKVITFDLDGLLVPKDHAYETMGLIPEGQKLFEVLSRYDDILTLDKREGHEPGKTLQFIVPFLVARKIGDADLHAVSQRMKLQTEASELIGELKTAGWNIFINSTCYQHHAVSVAQVLGIPLGNVFCSTLDLDYLNGKISKFGIGPALVAVRDSIMDYVVSYLYSEELSLGRKDREIKKYLDQIFGEVFKEMPGVETMIKTVTIRGGEGKEAALEIIAKNLTNTNYSEMVVVGESITDSVVLQKINEAGGLAIVFNGNEHALPHGTVGVCSTSLKDVLKLTQQWEQGGRKATKWFIESKNNFVPYQWLLGQNQEDSETIKKLHWVCRQACRGNSAHLV